MRLQILAMALVATVSTTAFAQDVVPAVARAGQTLRDSGKSRIGVIDRVNADGSVQVIVGTRFVTIPADKLVSAEGGVSTSLTKREVSKLR